MARAAFGDQVVDHYLNYARTEQAPVRQGRHRLGAHAALRARVRVVLISEVAPAVEGLSAMLRARGPRARRAPVRAARPGALHGARRARPRCAAGGRRRHARDRGTGSRRCFGTSTPISRSASGFRGRSRPMRSRFHATASSTAIRRSFPAIAARARLVGDPARRERDRLHLPLHGRRARHGNVLAQVRVAARRRARLGGADAEARDRGREPLAGCPRSESRRRPWRPAGRRRGQLLPPLRARVRVDRHVAIG